MSMDRSTLHGPLLTAAIVMMCSRRFLTYLQHVRYPANLGPEIDVANTGIG